MVDQKGFSLVELACAMVVITVALSAVFVSSAGSRQSVSRACYELTASAWLSGQLERLRVETDLQPIDRSLVVDASLQSQLPSPHARERVRLREPGLFELSVELAWRNPGSSKDTVIVLTTLKAAELTR